VPVLGRALGHVAACERPLDLLDVGWSCRCVAGLVLQNQVALGAEREGCDGWVGAEEGLIIAME
jgi:hypothetical protein